ncbi:histidine phosphatase family protein [Phaeobacter gallaeciensis]|uniref:histidine phosphatase family protein n=1 Tax=Phaeobacter gallaeciensis TaxID=60890 RepID=UPI0023801CFD|nr:histidine phosphatase family protein [Phaeobacter gallaeciensis]MDE4273958.1 histidine phosphatase family protein [Phaeobacter gallaeciensis]MDE4299198.1 histidine phosphatase family protein [Phaeobacter gallaeciensis]MDE5183944.1 histidine phosphatase family protein [Phaeobacter gallaeciensis]
MTRLFLVRHGPTHAKSMVGWSDLPADLSDSAALRRLSAALPEDALVVSSDLSRAADTASAIQGDRARLPHLPDLREIHFGEWELRTWKDIDAEDPERIRAYWETPGDVRPPGGESWNEVCARVDRVIDDLIEAHRGRNLIVVGHFGQILTQIQRAERLTAEEAFSHRIDNLSVTEIHHLPGEGTDGWRTGKINHLP